MLFFPLIGFLIGLVSLGIVTGFKPWFPERLENLCLVLLPILLTGGLHVDGFADFCDGFFQGKDREDILMIMKDPHIGVWGVVGIVFLIILKSELLMILPMKEKSFLLALTVSRWSHLLLCHFHPNARLEGGLAETIAKKVKLSVVITSGVFVLGTACWLRWRGIWTVVAAITFIVLAGLIYRKRLGGITGDLLGATSEMTEVVVFLVLVLIQ